MSGGHDAHGQGGHGHDAHGHDGHGHGGGAADVPALFGVVAAGFIALASVVLQGKGIRPVTPPAEHGAADGAATGEPWPAAFPGPADLILRNARVVAPGRLPASVILIKDGKIHGVGGPELELQRSTATVVRDMKGAAIIAGLRDAHGHLRSLGRRLNRECDLSQTRSLEDVRQTLATWITTVRKPKPGEWIVGSGWDESKWEEVVPPSREELEKLDKLRAEGKVTEKELAEAHQGKKVPGKKPESTDVLDELCPENPVILTRADGHSAWVNYRALILAKIGHDTFVPGGEVTRNPRTGEPTGMLVDKAVSLVTKLIPEDPPGWAEEDILRGAEACAAAGLVEVHDAGVDANEEAALRRLAQAGKLPIRVYAMVDAKGAAERLSVPAIKQPLGGRLVVRAVKAYADGAMGSHGAHLLAPYADKPASSGLPQTSREELAGLARLCAERGWQLCVHAIGDAANRTVLEVFESAGVAGKDLRFRVEHAQVLDPADIGRFAKLGVIASMQPCHVLTDKAWVEKRVGPARLAGAYAWRSLLDSGAVLAFGSDFPVEPESPLLGLYAAVTRTDATGQPPGGWQPKQKLGADEALRAFTEGPAFASFAEKERGPLLPGMDADLTVLDADPRAVLGSSPRKLLDATVIDTYVGGVSTRRR